MSHCCPWPWLSYSQDVSIGSFTHWTFWLLSSYSVLGTGERTGIKTNKDWFLHVRLLF